MLLFLATILLLQLQLQGLAEAKLYYALPAAYLERARALICELARDFDEGSSFVRWDTSCCFAVNDGNSYAVKAFNTPAATAKRLGGSAGAPGANGGAVDDVQRSFAHWRDLLVQKGAFSVYFVTDRERRGGKEEYQNNSNFCLEQRQLPSVYQFLKCDDSLFTK